MATLMVCIADDFTGATDLASLLARSGVRASLRMGVPQEEPANTARPAMLVRGHDARMPDRNEVAAIVEKFDLEWGD